MTRFFFERLAAREFAGAVLALLLLCSTHSAVAQGDSPQAYRVDDRVELHIAGPHWQRCRVTENNPGGLMRGLCEEYVEPAPGTYRRAAGTYILSKGDVRPVGTTATPEPQTPRSGAGSLSSRATDKVVAGASFAIGDKVEIEASNHWVPCVVAENKPPSIMRVRCEAYPRLSRDAGIYTVDRDNPQAVRKATDATGPVVPPAAKPAPRPGAAGGAGLKLGEYACYGSGGRILAGLGFKVLPGNRFTNLDGGNAGTYSVSGDTISFRGGHLGGQAGRELRNFNFRIGAQASCEPF